MAKHVLQVTAFANALVKADILHEEDLSSITRVVIDCDAKNGMVNIHITRAGDDPMKIAEALIPVMKGVFDD